MKIVVCGEGSKRGSGQRIMIALLAKGVQERLRGLGGRLGWIELWASSHDWL